MPRKTRPPYEHFGVGRERVEADYQAWVQTGWIGCAHDDGLLIRENSAKFGFMLDPRSGWEQIGYEVRLIQLSMIGLARPSEKGHIELVK